jgi:hypothetical protein
MIARRLFPSDRPVIFWIKRRSKWIGTFSGLVLLYDDDPDATLTADGWGFR